MKIKAPTTRSAHLISTAGTSAFLKAGEERTLPPMFAQDAAAKGCAILPDEGEVAPPQPVQTSVSADAEQRQSNINAAVQMIVARGNSEDFIKTGPNAGKVKVAVVQSVSGLDATSAEISAAHAELVNGNDGA